MDTILETHRLRLRTYRAKDLVPMFKIFGDPIVMKYFGSGADPTLERTAWRIQSLLEHQIQHGFSMWVVEQKENGEIIGDCGLKTLEEGPKIEVGYRFAQAHWGKGYATEAAQACLHYGFLELSMDRIVAIAKPENIASQRVMQKIGMHYVGTAYYYESDVVMYDAIKDKWLAWYDQSTHV